jgi:hypothetical protein
MTTPDPNPHRLVFHVGSVGRALQPRAPAVRRITPPGGIHRHTPGGGEAGERQHGLPEAVRVARLPRTRCGLAGSCLGCGRVWPQEVSGDAARRAPQSRSVRPCASGRLPVRIMITSIKGHIQPRVKALMPVTMPCK